MRTPEKIYIDGTKRNVQGDVFTAYSFDHIGHVEYTRSDKAAEASKEMTKAFVEFCSEMTMAKNALSKFNEVYDEFINSRKAQKE